MESNADFLRPPPLDQLMPDAALKTMRLAVRAGNISLKRPALPKNSQEINAWVIQDLPYHRRSNEIPDSAATARTLVTMLGQYALLSGTVKQPSRGYVRATLGPFVNDCIGFKSYGVSKPHTLAARHAVASLEHTITRYRDSPLLTVSIIRQLFERYPDQPEKHIIMYITQLRHCRELIPALESQYGALNTPRMSALRSMCLMLSPSYREDVEAFYTSGGRDPASPFRVTMSRIKEYSEPARLGIDKIRQALRQGDFSYSGQTPQAAYKALSSPIFQLFSCSGRYAVLDRSKALHYVARSLSRYNCHYPEDPLDTGIKFQLALSRAYMDDVIDFKRARAYSPYTAARYQDRHIYDTLSRRYPDLPQYTYQYALDQGPRDPAAWLDRMLLLRSRLKEIMLTLTAEELGDAAATAIATRKQPGNPEAFMASYVLRYAAIKGEWEGYPGVETWMIQRAVATDPKNPRRQIKILSNMKRNGALTGDNPDD